MQRKLYRYIFQLTEDQLLKAYEEFPNGFEIVEHSPGRGYAIAVYSEGKMETFPFHLIGKEEVVYRDWREYYQPIPISDKTVIIPPWEAAEERWREKTAVIIKPGKAFGTGLHETTQLSLLLLEKEQLMGKRVLDVGCGSGILSVFAAKRGADRVVAVDIDPLAVEETLENAELNKVSDRLEVLRGGPEGVEGTYDVVVANLELHIFREVLKDIVPKIGKVGIFSGLYRVEELIEFLRMLKEAGLKPTHVVEKNDWYAVRAVKNNS